MPKVILKGFILVPDDDLAMIQKELENHKHLTRNEPGCLVFEVNQDSKNPNRFDVYEEFIDKAAFEAHQTRVKNAYWGQITKHIKRHYDIYNET